VTVSKTYSAQIQGIEAYIVTIEVDITHGLHSFSIVGLGDKSIEESKDRISAAIKNSGFTSPKQKNQKVVISLAPAYMKKGGSSFDLAMAIAYLKTAGEIHFDSEKIIFLGELSLDGNISEVSGILAMIQSAKKHGFEKIYIPKSNTSEAALIQGVSIFPVKNMREVINHLEQKISIDPLVRHSHSTQRSSSEPEEDFSKIYGQENAKRALEIAAAGKHNIVLYGPPGTGKTTLARAFISILPDLSLDETIESAHIHSISKNIQAEITSTPPFRSPHHSSSAISIIGGGNSLRPGEITLAHRGVLFMDEFPEFDRKIIDSLRQPLEDKSINISRANGTLTYPADFILIGSMNPCPCGYTLSESNLKKCVCTDYEKIKYRKKISGPIVDRIDLWAHLSKATYTKDDLGETSKNTLKSSATIKGHVQNSRIFAEKNKHMKQYQNISDLVRKILIQFSKKYDISNRAYLKTIAVARTIANLDESVEIKEKHLLEALQYRQKML
jgi:magnesium chelatase family protein